MKLDRKFFETHKEKLNKIIDFVLIVFGYGALINYTLLIIANIPFVWYGFPAFGIVYYFIMEEFVVFFRKLRAKIYT
jgi:hypothetical protein